MILDEIDYGILEALSRNMTLEQMKNFLKKRTKREISSYIISRKLKKLKNYGYLIERFLSEKGINFTIAKDPSHTRSFNINCSQFCKFIIISDTHIGNINDNIPLLNSIYNYASDNSIDFVFHTGDLIEGIKPYRQSYSKFSTTAEQLKEVIRIYPKKEGISTGILLGNHDKYSIEQIGFDIKQELENRRLDIITLGYISSSIRINNINMVLYHNSGISSVEGRIKFLESPVARDADIVFSGHCHTSLMLEQDGIPFIFVPPLFPGKNNNRRQSAYECKLVSKTGDNELSAIKISPLVVENKDDIYPVTTVEYVLKKDRK